MGGTSNKARTKQGGGSGKPAKDTTPRSRGAGDPRTLGSHDDSNTTAADSGRGAGISNITITVFGMSTEGYEIARRTAVGGASVYLVDESNLTAILFNAEIARTYPDIFALQEDEPIMSFVPLQDAVSESDYLFFAPRIRTQYHNTKASMQSLFQDAVEFAKRDASVVLCVPVGIGENSDFVSVLQHDTGLVIGTDASYYYYPAEAGRAPPAIGSATPDAQDDLLVMMLPPDTEDGARPATLAAAEHLHVIDTVSRFSRIGSLVEIGLSIPDESSAELSTDGRMEQMYIDDMVGGMFDMRQIERSLERTKPLQKVVVMHTNTIESYTRRLMDKIKRAARNYEMRTTKIKIIILWSFDPHLLRGDRNAMCGLLAERANDWVSDVEVLTDPAHGVSAADKHVIIIACSQRDLEAAAEAKVTRPDLLIIKANTLCEVFDAKHDGK